MIGTNTLSILAFTFGTPIREWVSSVFFLIFLPCTTRLLDGISHKNDYRYNRVYVKDLLQKKMGTDNILVN